MSPTPPSNDPQRQDGLPVHATKTPDSVQQHHQSAPTAVPFSVITVSDTRSLENDGSGQLICDLLTNAGHPLVQREIVPDEPLEICSALGRFTADATAQAIVLTGGTGFSPRDRTPEAVQPLLDAELPGFGELFRMLSYQEIGPAAMLSRALAGRIGSVFICCLPGSTAAVRLAVERLLLPELPHLISQLRK